MNEMPDAEAFARIVLWDLALLRSSMAELQAEVICQIHDRTGKPLQEIEQALRERIQARAEQSFQEARKAAGLKDFPGPNRN